MDSLLANYASSDEEEEQQQKHKPSISAPLQKPTQIHDDILSVTNKPSLLFSLPPPKSSSSILSSLPAPKASRPNPFNLPTPSASSSPQPKPKKIVQFKPPVISSGINGSFVDDDDEEDEEEKEKEKRREESEFAMQTRSVKSFLSSLPVPKSSGTLGALPLGSATSRRSILEADVPAFDSNGSSVGNEVSTNSNVGPYEGQPVFGSMVSSSGAVDGSYPSEYVGPVGGEGGYESYADYQGYTGYGNSNGNGDGDGEYSNWVGPNGEQYSNYASNYGAYGDYGQVEHNWVDSSNASSQELPESAESALRVTGKRGRNDAPPKIVEVKQDELMKNRPREDQVRTTGIAFGPAYKPASTKGKPTKLHKRKHQIGALYFDMRQKETELAERRSRGMLTKAQTQGKYGW